ncbi:MAG: transcriptional regulator, LysR family, partial [Rhodoferax sp.]|nr:transcriptional regulator, LysR family [Rhodoferax sp.]
MARTDQDSDEAGLLSPKLLRLMESLHTTRSVTRTAEKLGQTQSTVSILLARARAQLGDPLFVRTPEGMLPTPRTDALMPKVQKVLEYLRDMAAGDAGFEPATSKREFRIIMTDASHITMLPRLFSHVRAMAPKIRLEAATIDAGMADSLQSGHCHLAIGQLPALEAGFYRQTLHGQDWICLANAGHPRIAQRFTVKDYLAEAHVGIASGTGPMVDEALKQQGLQREVLLELPGF